MSAKPAPWHGRRLHLVGVGGAGMSAYARAAHALGAQVSGSDRLASPFTDSLAADGVLRAHIGHSAAHVPPGDDVEVVYSSAVLADNPERAAARHRGLTERPRAHLLGELTALRRTVAVAGAHGKTTTASMIVHLLTAAGLQPGYLVGAMIGPAGVNARWSEAEWLVVEADESDRSMLAVEVEVAVLTNVELDHHATFGSLTELQEAFRSFLDGPPQAVVWDRPELLRLRTGPVVAYDVPAPTLLPGGSRFDWRGLQVRLCVPGAHNAVNAAGALEVARLAGADPALCAAALPEFRGAARRFERVGRTAAGALVYDDYAHHPTEVAATLNGARTLGATRLVAIFQPHLYSRTRMLAGELGRALALADVIVVLEVYGSRERADDHPGVSGRLVAQAAADAAAGRLVYWLPSFADAQRALAGLLTRDDLVVVMGAGDSDALARRLVSTGAGAALDGAPAGSPPALAS